MATLGQLDLILGADLRGLKQALGETKVEAEKSARGFSQAFSGGLEGILSDIARVKSGLGSAFTDKSQAIALREQSALLQEQIRFRQELARIDAAGLDEKDAQIARQLAEELNRVNLDRIAQDAREAKVSLDQLGKSTLGDLKQDLTQAQIALANVSGDDRASRALRQQAALLQENIRFKRQLAGIDSAGLDEKDAKAARDLANEINRVNLQRIDKEARQAAGGMGFLRTAIAGVAQGITQELTSRALNSLFGAFRGVTGAIGGAIGTFSEFDGQLTRMGALSGQARDELQPLTDLIKQLGAETSKSPVEIAAATNELIALGSSAEQAQEQIRGVVALSESTGQSLELAGQVVQTTRNIFDEISSDDLADKLATLANTTAVGSLNDTLQLLSKVGAVGKGVGEDFDGLAAAFATLRDTGSTAEVAATALKGALQNVTTPTDEAKAKLEELGITTFDSSGKFVGLFEVLEQLKEKTSKLNDEDRSEALGAIFSRGSIAQVTTLIQNLDKVDKTYQNLQKSAGAAAESAAKLVSSDTLSGATLLLEGSIETLALDLGEAISPFLIGFKDGFTNVINQLLASKSLFDNLRAAGEQFKATLEKNPQIITAIANGLKQVIGTLQASVGGALQSLTENLAQNPQIVQDFTFELVNLTRELAKIIELGGKIAGFLLSNTSVITQIIKGLAVLKGTQIAIGVTQGAVTAISSLSTGITATTAAAGAAAPALTAFNAAMATNITSVTGLKVALSGVTAAIPATAAGLKALAASAVATTGPFVALGAAIAVALVARRGQQLRVEREEVEALGNATNQLADESLGYASKLKALNAAEEKNGNLTAEQKRQREGLIKLANESIAANNAQIQALQGLETPNEALNNAIQAQIALLEGRNALLERQIAPGATAVTVGEAPGAAGAAPEPEEVGGGETDPLADITDTLDQKGRELVRKQNEINSQLAAGKITQEEADKRLTQATIDNANARIQAIQQELNRSLGADNAEKREQLQGQLEEAQTEKLQAEIEKRDRLRQEELAKIESANAKAAAAIQQSQNARILAVKQQQAAGVITVEQAVNQIAAIEQNATQQTIAQKQAELAQVDQLRQRNLISEQEASDRILGLQGEIGQLRLQQVDQELAAQEQLRQAREQAAEEEKQRQLEAVQADYGTRTGQLEYSMGSDQVESGFVGIEQNLLGAEVQLQQSLNELANSRLETQIAQAEAAGNTAKAEQLRTQLLEQQQEQALALLDLEAEQLELSQYQAQLDAQSKVDQAELNVLKAQQALIEAQINGASATQIANLERQLGIAGKQLDLAKAQQGSLADLQAKERQILDAKRDQTAEQQKQQDIAEKQRRSESEKSSSGESGGGSGGKTLLKFSGAEAAAFNALKASFRSLDLGGLSKEEVIKTVSGKLDQFEGRIRGAGVDRDRVDDVLNAALSQTFKGDLFGQILGRDKALEEARKGGGGLQAALLETSQFNQQNADQITEAIAGLGQQLAGRPQSVQFNTQSPLADADRFLTDQSRRLART